jgi:hypothetical protein
MLSSVLCQTSCFLLSDILSATIVPQNGSSTASQWMTGLCAQSRFEPQTVVLFSVSEGSYKSTVADKAMHAPSSIAITLNLS